MLGLIGAIFSALGFGSANIVIKKSLADLSIPQTLTMSSLSGAVVLLLICLGLGVPIFESWQVVGLAAIFAVAEVILYIVLYKSLEESNVSVAISIMATYPILSTVIAVLFLSEVLNLPKALSILGMVVGTVFVSVDWHKVMKDGLSPNDIVKGFKWILLAMVLHGLYFPLLGWFTGVGLWQSKLLLIKFFSTVIMAVFFYGVRKQKILPPRSLVPFTSLLGLLEVIGWFGFSWAVSSTTGQTAVIVAALNASSLVTAVLAYFFLKEKLSPLQYAGMILVVMSLTGLSLSV
jgi:drug/metabolite transporter (DMT)-like permease